MAHPSAALRRSDVWDIFLPQHHELLISRLISVTLCIGSRYPSTDIKCSVNNKRIQNVSFLLPSHECARHGNFSDFLSDPNGMPALHFTTPRLPSLARRRQFVWRLVTASCCSWRHRRLPAPHVTPVSSPRHTSVYSSRHTSSVCSPRHSSVCCSRHTSSVCSLRHTSSVCSPRHSSVCCSRHTSSVCCSRHTSSVCSSRHTSVCSSRHTSSVCSSRHTSSVYSPRHTSSVCCSRHTPQSAAHVTPPQSAPHVTPPQSAAHVTPLQSAPHVTPP